MLGKNISIADRLEDSGSSARGKAWLRISRPPEVIDWAPSPIELAAKNQVNSPIRMRPSVVTQLTCLPPDPRTETSRKYTSPSSSGLSTSQTEPSAVLKLSAFCVV